MTIRAPQILGEIGGVSLERHVRYPERAQSEMREDVVDDLIGRINSPDIFENERLPLRQALTREMQYPILDTAFMGAHNLFDYKGVSLPVPKFTYHAKTEKGFEQFKMIWLIYSERKGFCLKIKINPSISQQREKHSDSNILYKPIISALISLAKKRTGEENKRFCDVAGYNNAIELSANFNGIIPQETKNSIRLAETIFGKDVYLIEETKPEEWNAEVVRRDPLIVGVLSNVCYLVDHFNTTPAEDYVKREFSV